MTIGTRENPANNNTAVTEPKVKAAAFGATGGAGTGAILAQFVLWLVDNYLLTPHVEGDVPGPVALFVYLACTAGLAWVVAWWAGRRAQHQWRQAEIARSSREASEKVREPDGLE